jgi:cytochrome P450
VSTQRNAKKTFTFSDGTVIPAGAKIGTLALFVQKDNDIYPNGDVFDGFRFSKMAAEGKPRQQAVTTDPAYQLFGHGKHAW